ncbi:MAG: NAD-dependent epimerase/dehydratase family protein [candidate division KSB1 bacterium]|nr:NAD-dependent epimerase/dehydratase family protein [candidate division KSB1 bacterium]
MRALVTGVNGFVGSYLAEHLVARGWEVRGLVRRTSNLRWIRDLKIELAYGEVTQPDTLPAAVDGMDVVFHVAGLTKARRSTEYFAVNAQGTAHLLEACVKNAPGLKRFVLVSSQAAAGPSEGPTPKVESDEPCPVTSYGRSKLLAEQIALRYNGQLPVTIVRPSAVYGPRDRDLLVLYRYVARGWKPLLGRRPRLVSVIHVLDLVRGIVAAAESEGAVGQTYFLAHRQPVEWEEFADAVAEALGRKARRLVLPAWVLLPAAAVSEVAAWFAGRPATLNREKTREIRQRYWVCSVDKARSELGFEAEIPLREGLRETLQWYRREGWL